MSAPNLPRYVLITPARNEEAFVEKTLSSMVSQTMLPERWVIVSDGSTDRTDEIVERYLPGNPWIEFIRLPQRRDRQFAAKVGAFDAGYDRVRHLPHDIVGNLDADISFDNDYLEYLLGKFSTDPQLGVAGTPFVEKGYSTTRDSFEGEKHVAGGCQLFRKECFQDVGGYTPIRGGGIDWTAVTTARMKGWKTVSFPEKTFFHYRKLGTGESNVARALFSYGLKDYYLGGHPVWEAFRGVYRMTKRPYVLGGAVLLSGYLWGMINRVERPVTEELVRFHRKEQMAKLKGILVSLCRRSKVRGKG